MGVPSGATVMTAARAPWLITTLAHDLASHTKVELFTFHSSR